MVSSLSAMENGLIQITDKKRLQAASEKPKGLRSIYKASPIIITLLMDLIKSKRCKWIMDRKSISKNNGLEKTQHER